MGISGISGGGNIYQPRESNQPDFSQFKHQINDYFSNPTEGNYFQLKITARQLEGDRNLLPDQLKTVQELSANLTQFNDLQIEIGQLKLTNPDNPNIQEDEDLQSHLQMTIEQAASSLK